MEVIVESPVVQESVFSLQVLVNGFLKSRVRGLLSGVLVHVFTPGMLLDEQSLAVN